MGDTQLERALDILRAEDHSVGQMSGSPTMIYVMIDGQNLSRTEILEITKTPDSTWPFEADGKQYAVLIYLDQQGMAYEVRQGRKRIGERQRAPETEHSERELAQRIIRGYVSSKA